MRYKYEKLSVILKTGPVVFFFVANTLKLLTSKKKGGFAVLQEGLFGETSSTLIAKNFSHVKDVSLNKTKAEAEAVCQRGWNCQASQRGFNQLRR